MDRTTENIAIGGYPQQPTTQQGNGGYPQQQIAQPGGGGFGFGHPPPQPNGTNTNPMFPNNNHCKYIDAQHKFRILQTKVHFYNDKTQNSIYSHSS